MFISIKRNFYKNPHDERVPNDQHENNNNNQMAKLRIFVGNSNYDYGSKQSHMCEKNA